MQTEQPGYTGGFTEQVNLWDMFRFHAEKFVAASNILGQMMMEISLRKTMPSSLSAQMVDKNLQMLAEHCGTLGLVLSEEHARRMRAEYMVEAARTHGTYEPLAELEGHLRELQLRMRDEMSHQVYLQISARNRCYFDQSTPLFGQAVFDCFPSAIEDIEEAGNCLAFDRATACVFHLMRVMEAGLKVLAKELTISYAPSWEAYLKQLNSIAGDWKTLPQDVKEKMPFYKEIIGDSQSIKIAWRNPTMHIVRRYNASEAEIIYAAVKQLMCVLADKGLKE